MTTVPYFFGSVPAFLVLYNVCEESCQELPQNGYRISELQERSGTVKPPNKGVLGTNYSKNLHDGQKLLFANIQHEAKHKFHFCLKKKIVSYLPNVLYISFCSDGSPTYFGVISHFASNVTEIQNSSCCGLSSEANEYFVSHARWFSMAIFMFTGRSMTEVFLRSWVTVLVTATLMARIPDQHIQCLLILSLILTKAKLGIVFY